MAVYPASERQYAATGGEVQVPRVIFTSDGRWSEEVDTRIGKVNAVLRGKHAVLGGNAVLRELYRSVVTKRELSNTASCQFLNRSLFRPLPMVMNLGL